MITRLPAIVRGGVIVPREPIDWPDGTEVEVSPVERDDDTPDSPEEIERWLAEFQAIPPLMMTAEEEAMWTAERQCQREYDATMAEAVPRNCGRASNEKLLAR